MKRETVAETAAGEALGAKSEAVAKKPRQRTLAAAGNRPSTNPSRGKSSVQDAGGKTGDARAVATQRRRGADVQARRERAGLQPRASLATNPRRRGPAPRRPFGTNSVRSLTRSGTGLMVSDHFLFGSIGSGGVYKLSEGGAVASKIKPSYRGVIINGGYEFKSYTPVVVTRVVCVVCVDVLCVQGPPPLLATALIYTLACPLGASSVIAPFCCSLPCLTLVFCVLCFVFGTRCDVPLWHSLHCRRCVPPVTARDPGLCLSGCSTGSWRLSRMTLAFPERKFQK